MPLFSSLYIEVAGFCICLHFYDASPSYAYLKERLLRQIMLLTEGFIIYESTSNIDFTIDFIEEDTFPLYILKKRKTSAYAHIFSKISNKKGVTFYSISLAQFQLLLANIVHELLSSEGSFFLHTSASLINNRAVLFLGPPGAGKSTIVNLLADVFQPLVDDTAVIRKHAGEYYLYQLPCFEKNKEIKRSRNKYLVGGLCVIKKSKIVKLVDNYNELLLLKTVIDQAHLFGSVKSNKKYLLVSRLVSRVKCVYLYFPKNGASFIEVIRSYFFPTAKQ